jgi:hypothetical protein
MIVLFPEVAGLCQFKPQSTDALKVNIINVIERTYAVTENWTTRIRATMRSHGGHLNDANGIHGPLKKKKRISLIPDTQLVLFHFNIRPSRPFRKTLY